MILPRFDPTTTSLLVGAGVSIDPPSGIPAAALLMDALIEWMARKRPGLRRQFDELRLPPRRRRPYQGPYATLRFELLLDWLLYFRPEVMEALPAIATRGIPNRWHHWVAALMRDGARVLTTNFDTRIEEACAADGIAMRRCVVSEDMPRIDALTRSNLVKLHGTFPSTAVASAGAQPVGSLRQIAQSGLGYGRVAAVRRALLQLLGARTLIVCGYSGWDSFDVMPLLESVPSSTRIIWLEWRAAGGLVVCERVRVEDPLTAWRRRASPVDLFIAHRSWIGAAKTTHRIRAASAGFLDVVWEHRGKRTSSRGGPSISSPKAEENLKIFQKGLRLIEPLSADEARLIVESLSAAYGNEAVADRQLEGVPDPPPLRGQARLRRALEEGDIHLATRRFVEEIERQELDGDLQTYSENLVWILEKMFWHALQLGQHAQAQRLVRQLQREAARRRVLWALVLGTYLDGNLLHSRAARTPDPSRRRRLLAVCRQRLWQAVRYSVRVPRLDIAVDAARLLLYVEADSRQQRRLELVIERWLPSVQAGENHFLALFDLLRRHVMAGRRGAPRGLLQRMTRMHSSGVNIVMAADYIAIARCYVALYRPGPAFRHALAALQDAIAESDPRFRDELRTEMRLLIANERTYRQAIRRRAG